MKNIVILGSTGSIGVSALSSIEKLGKDYRVVGLCANSNADLLLSQAVRFKPKFITLFDAFAAERIKGKLPKNVKLLPPGLESLIELSVMDNADLIINGLVGSIGFIPLLASIKAGKTIALANKEPMVMAGSALMKEAHRWNATVIPVDSEPSAVFQCLNGKTAKYNEYDKLVSRIFLTASGGPFLNYKKPLSKVTPEQALKHPRWKMGKKITIDSATLLNKGFEAIEIQKMFGLPLEKINIVVHPQSIIHSAVEFNDNSALAQMSLPDMRLPIQYAITYPDMKKSAVQKVNLFEIGKFEFLKPDFKRFPCLDLAIKSAKKGGTFPACLSAADEVAVDLFLGGQLSFTGIARLIEAVLAKHKSAKGEPSISDAVEADIWAREKALEIFSNRKFKRN
jgi:1-deoxy-D-xylulose-5-phosphate reductoisomerase